MMSSFNQSEQNVSSQYNAGRDIVIVSKLGKPLTLKILKTDHAAKLSGVLGSSVGLDFELEKTHTIRYSRNEGLFSRTISVYVDGKQLLRKEFINPLERIEFPFELENIDCEFVWQGYTLVSGMKVRVGGYEIFSLNEVTL